MSQDGPLHLLRPFAQWRCEPTLKGAEERVANIALRHGVFGTPTRRCPKQMDALAGGSVYFCQKRHTLFRMPIYEIQPPDGKTTTSRGNPYRWTWIWMEPRIIRVEQVFIGMLRGWRYLKDSDRPMDLALPDDVPDNMDERLREVGVL